MLVEKTFYINKESNLVTEQTNTTQPHIFKIGATHIVEGASLARRGIDDAKTILQRSYPEIAHVTVREITLEDGLTLLEWLAQPGVKDKDYSAFRSLRNNTMSSPGA